MPGGRADLWVLPNTRIGRRLSTPPSSPGYCNNLGGMNFDGNAQLRRNTQKYFISLAYVSSMALKNS